MGHYDDAREEIRLRSMVKMAEPAGPHSCGRVGPQNGEPLCPCKMRGVVIKDGRYVLPERDLGPVRARQYGKASANVMQSGFGRFDA